MSTPQQLSGQMNTETGMEFCLTDQETEIAMPEDDPESDKPQPDLMDQAASIVNDLLDHIMGGREATIVLPQADPVILLIKEIAVKAQFPLSERIPKDEGTVELVHVGAEGPWSDLATASSCEELSKSSWSQPPDTDQEDVLILDMRVVEDQGEFQSSQHNARPSLEDIMASARPRTEPSHPYQPPQITAARGEWYEGEDSIRDKSPPPPHPSCYPLKTGG